MSRMIERLKKKYAIQTTFELVIIFCVFSLAGTTDSLTIRPLLHTLLKLLPKLPTYAYVIAYILLAVSLYQCFLLIYGFLFGQFKFFWQREKQLGRALYRLTSKAVRNFFCLFRKQESEYI